MTRLNIGCGRDYREGWVNVDMSKKCKADVYLDIRTQPLIKGGTIGYKGTDAHFRPILIEDDSVDEIYISGVLEQILENEHLIHALNECHRVLKPGAEMEVVVPNARFSIAHQDPMDMRKFTRETFPYFIAGMRQHELYGSVYGFKGWSTANIGENDRHILTIKMRK